VHDIVKVAADLAEAKLADALPRRWVHVQAVAAKAVEIGFVVPDPDVLTIAAWLHDIGYAPDVAFTGLHSLDGARWLTDHGWDDRLAGLVGNHSCALHEAQERGMADVLAREYPQEQSVTADALWYVDMTTGPDGQDVTAEQRLAEIRERYGPDDLVTRFWRHAEPELMEAVRRTKTRLAERQPM
jgi:lambda repressor-like predicted transcriptional regulator